jgi:Arc/MetJ family transcription regulator
VSWQRNFDEVFRQKGSLERALGGKRAHVREAVRRAVNRVTDAEGERRIGAMGKEPLVAAVYWELGVADP